MAGKRKINVTDMDLQKQISVLTGITEAGFKEVTRRQDLANGRLAEHDKLFSKIFANDSFQAGRRKGISQFWGVVIAVVGIIIGVITAYATFLHK